MGSRPGEGSGGEKDRAEIERRRVGGGEKTALV